MRNIHAHGGFTLVELLVTTMVAAILLAVAIPSFTTFVQNDRDAAQINSLVLSLNYARSEAVKQNLATGITVCPSTNAQTCSGAANWAGGWVVRDADLTHPPLQTVPALAGSNTVTATGAGTGITFQSSGLASAPLAITICDRRGASFARAVEVNATGRIAASPTPGQNLAGTALTCP